MVVYNQINLNQKTVLVTGGAGFIGSNLVLHIQHQFPDCQIVVLDDFRGGHFKNLEGFRGICLAGDISDPEAFRQLKHFRFDYIFHQAAISDTTVDDQGEVVRVNTNAFQTILQLARSMSAPLVYASSAAVYGNVEIPHRVGRGETPENVYGFSKLMMEHLANRHLDESGPPVVGLRYFNVFGPRESYKGRMASMILQLSQQIISQRKPRLFKHGEQRRDFVYVGDVVQANMKALTAKKSGVFNVGTGRSRQFNEVHEILSQVLGIKTEIEYIDNPWSFYQNHTEADIEPTVRTLGYEPQFTLEDGIEAYAPEIRRLHASGGIQ